jgi:hypothetical protein
LRGEERDSVVERGSAARETSNSYSVDGTIQIERSGTSGRCERNSVRARAVQRENRADTPSRYCCLREVRTTRIGCGITSTDRRSVGVPTDFVGVVAARATRIRVTTINVGCLVQRHVVGLGESRLQVWVGAAGQRYLHQQGQTEISRDINVAIRSASDGEVGVNQLTDYRRIVRVQTQRYVLVRGEIHSRGEPWDGTSTPGDLDIVG